MIESCSMKRGLKESPDYASAEGSMCCVGGGGGLGYPHLLQHFQSNHCLPEILTKYESVI